MLKKLPGGFRMKTIEKQSYLSSSELVEGVVLKTWLVNINKILDLKAWLDNAI